MGPPSLFFFVAGVRICVVIPPRVFIFVLLFFCCCCAAYADELMHPMTVNELSSVCICNLPNKNDQFGVFFLYCHILYNTI